MLDGIDSLKSRLNDPELLATRANLAGEWADADSSATFDVTNPASGDVIAGVADPGRAEVARAIEAGRIAQKDWAAKDRATGSRTTWR